MSVPQQTWAVLAVAWLSALVATFFGWPVNMFGWPMLALTFWIVRRHRRWERARRQCENYWRARGAIEVARWRKMKIALTCVCRAEYVVDASMVDEDERERRLQAAAEWSAEHSGDGHGLAFNLPGIARGGPRREGTER